MWTHACISMLMFHNDVSITKDSDYIVQGTNTNANYEVYQRSITKCILLLFIGGVTTVNVRLQDCIRFELQSNING